MSANDTDVDERVDRLLGEADDLLEKADDPAALLEDDDLQAVADETRSLLDDAETSELLAAVGVDVSGESSPADLVMALQDADTEPLVRRRRLDLLSEIDGDDADDEDDGSAIEEFQALGVVLEEGTEADVDPLEGEEIDVDGLDLGEDEGAPDGDGSDTDDAAEADDDGDAEEVEAPDAESEADDDEADSGLAQHAGALKDAVDDIVDRDPDASDRSDRAAAEEAADDGEPGSDEQIEAQDGEEGATGYEESKIAASDRADMRVPLRHSTMPK